MTDLSQQDEQITALDDTAAHDETKRREDDEIYVALRGRMHPLVLIRALVSTRRRRRILVGVALAMLCAGAVLYWYRSLAPQVVQDQREAAVDCLNEAYHSFVAPTSACVPTGMALWLAEHAGGQESEIAQIRSDINYSIAEGQLHVAVVKGELESAERIAASLIELSRVEPTPDMFFSSFGALSHAGLLDFLSRQLEQVQRWSELKLVFDAALAQADLEVALAAARVTATPDKYDYEDLLKFGALLCMAGQKEAGVQRLREAEKLYSSTFKAEPYDDARLAMVACGGLPEGEESALSMALEGSYHRDEVLSILGGQGDLEALTSIDRYALKNRHRTAMLIDDVPMLKKRTLGGQLAIVAENCRSYQTNPRVRPDLRSCFLPTLALTEHETLLTSPETHIPAAARLVEYAATLPPITEELVPKWPDTQCVGDIDAYEYIDDLAKMDAFALRQLAVFELLWRGQVEAAAPLLDALSTTTPEDLSSCLATANLLAGRAKEAFALLKLKQEEVLTTSGELAGLGITLLTVIAQAEAGDPAGAYERLDPVYRAVAEVPEVIAQQEQMDIQMPSVVRIFVAAAWVRASLAVRTGRAVDTLGLPPPPVRILKAVNGLQVLAWFVPLCGMDPESRARALFFDSADLSGAPFEVLPEVLHVAGTCMDTGGRLEPLLDAASFSLPLEGLRAYWMAQAKAAHWRGDESAAQRWNSGAATFLDRIDSPSKAYLAQVVGL